MLDIWQASPPHAGATRSPLRGDELDMKNKARAPLRRHRRSGISVLLLVSMVLLGEDCSAQTIRVDTTPGRAIRFDPDQALGTSMDILPSSQLDTVYSEAILKES